MAAEWRNAAADRKKTVVKRRKAVVKRKKVTMTMRGRQQQGRRRVVDGEKVAAQ